MCFSSSACFGVGVILGTIGVVNLRKVTDRTQIPFAAIPMMLAVQQFSEGILWVGLSDPASTWWQHTSVYFSLIYAQLIWPSWIPFSLLCLEKDPARRKLLLVFMTLGLLVSGYLLYCLFPQNVSAELHSGHIRYNLNLPFASTWAMNIIYFIPTVISLFVSSFKGMTPLAIAILITFFATKVFFDDYLISVWCSFAAGLSLMVVWITSMFGRHNKSIVS